MSHLVFRVAFYFKILLCIKIQFSLNSCKFTFQIRLICEGF